MTTTISPADFEFVSRLLLTEAAIVLEKGKEYLVESRLTPMAREMGYGDLNGLVRQLQKEHSKELIRKIVESLTTHETSFFRDSDPYEVIRTVVLPKLMESQRAAQELTIWSAAASSGQEAYSLCMLIREHFPQLMSWKLRIIATDISNAILERAKTGKYSQVEVQRGLPPHFLEKYFEPHGSEWQIKDDIRQMVEFSELNLMHPYGRLPAADLVMLRNVLIYFDMSVKRDILGKVRGVLKPHGYLFLGTAETTINIDENYQRVMVGKVSCYQKKG
jgi:chemotaxis protein methyltransferase CheR